MPVHTRIQLRQRNPYAVTEFVPPDTSGEKVVLVYIGQDAIAAEKYRLNV